VKGQIPKEFKIRDSKKLEESNDKADPRTEKFLRNLLSGSEKEQNTTNSNLYEGIPSHEKNKKIINDLLSVIKAQQIEAQRIRKNTGEDITTIDDIRRYHQENADQILAKQLASEYGQEQIREDEILARKFAAEEAVKLLARRGHIELSSNDHKETDLEHEQRYWMKNPSQKNIEVTVYTMHNDYANLHRQLEKYRRYPEELSNEKIKDIVKTIREETESAYSKSYEYLDNYEYPNNQDLDGKQKKALKKTLEQYKNKIERRNNVYKRIYKEYNKFSDKERKYSKEDTEKILKAVSGNQRAVIKLVKFAIDFQDKISDTLEPGDELLNKELKDFVDQSPISRKPYKIAKYDKGSLEIVQDKKSNYVLPLFERNPYRDQVEDLSTESSGEETFQESDRDISGTRRTNQPLSDAFGDLSLSDNEATMETSSQEENNDRSISARKSSVGSKKGQIDREREVRRISDTRRKWEKEPDSYAQELEELNNAQDTDEEKGVVDKYIPRRVNRSREEQIDRNRELKRIRDTRYKWEKEPDSYVQKLEELNNAQDTDEEKGVVDKYIRRRFNRSREEQIDRESELKRIRNTRYKWKKEPDSYAQKLEELNNAQDTDEEKRVVDKYIQKKGIRSKEGQIDRERELKRISNSRRKWKKEPDSYAQELEELNNAQDTDEEKRVVDKYILRRVNRSKEEQIDREREN
jgi:hypothetical protein